MVKSSKFNKNLFFFPPQHYLVKNYLSFIVKYIFENAVLFKNSGTKDFLCHIIGTCATKVICTTCLVTYIDSCDLIYVGL
ncbi:unnamed protein product, partial [Vitis vinifera]|uniref:Uncharacterized protein n=1 Tax=Vitis vinifera TaxID=29760 RepID=D7T5N5_VITVI